MLSKCILKFHLYNSRICKNNCLQVFPYSFPKCSATIYVLIKTESVFAFQISIDSEYILPGKEQL